MSRTSTDIGRVAPAAQSRALAVRGAALPAARERVRQFHPGKRPAIGHFQAPFFVQPRREGPALVPEEFALQQAF